MPTWENPAEVGPKNDETLKRTSNGKLSSSNLSNHTISSRASSGSLLSRIIKLVTDQLGFQEQSVSGESASSMRVTIFSSGGTVCIL